MTFGHISCFPDYVVAIDMSCSQTMDWRTNQETERSLQVECSPTVTFPGYAQYEICARIFLTHWEGHHWVDLCLCEGKLYQLDNLKQGLPMNSTENAEKQLDNIQSHQLRCTDSSETMIAISKMKTLIPRLTPFCFRCLQEQMHELPKLDETIKSTRQDRPIDPVSIFIFHVYYLLLLDIFIIYHSYNRSAYSCL